MNKLLAIMSLFIALSTTGASADEARKPAEIKRIPAHNPEWTNPMGSDPGKTESSIPELQEIVVLCATRPQAAEFKKQWAAYVRGNYKRGMNIDAMINDVIRRADEYQAGKRKGSKEPTTEIVQKPVNTRKLMHDTAMSVIRNIGS